MHDKATPAMGETHGYDPTQSLSPTTPFAPAASGLTV
jgi:hypothetical protein